MHQNFISLATHPLSNYQIIRELPTGLQENAISDRIISLTDHGLYTDLLDVVSELR